MPYPGPFILGEWGRSTELAPLWAWDTAHVPSSPLEPGTSAPLSEVVGVFPVFWGALDSSQKDVTLSLPGRGMGTAHCPVNLGMGGTTEARLIWVSSAWGAGPLFSSCSCTCGTWVCLLRKISFPAEGWQCPCRVGVGLQHSMVPVLHPLLQTLAA